VCIHSVLKFLLVLRKIFSRLAKYTRDERSSELVCMQIVPYFFFVSFLQNQSMTTNVITIIPYQIAVETRVCVGFRQTMDWQLKTDSSTV